MGVAQRVSNASIALYELVRSRHAAEAAAGAPSGDAESLRGHKQATIVTYRRNGEPVPTPVWFGLAGNRVYFRSVASGAKLRRIEHTPRVRVAPCTRNGRPRGPALAGRARLLTEPDDIARAEATIRSRYGLGRRLYMRMVASRVEGRYVEVMLDEDDEAPRA